jgi:hypothetical protein
MLGLVMALIGSIPMLRFLYYYFFSSGAGKIQSLVIGSALITVGILTFVAGLVADLLNHNRQLIEMTLEKVRRMEYAQNAARAQEAAQSLSDSRKEIDTTRTSRLLTPGE